MIGLAYGMHATPSDTPHPPVLSQDASFRFLLFFAGLMALCLIVPRALTIVPPVFGLMGLAYIRFHRQNLPELSLSTLWALAGIAALCFTSVLWSPDKSFAVERSFKILGMLIGAWACLSFAKSFHINTSHKHGILTFLCLIWGLGGAFLFFEYMSGFAISRVALGKSPGNFTPIDNGFLYNRASVFLLLGSFPLLLGLKLSALPSSRKWSIFAAMMLGVAAGIYSTGSQTAQIASICALLMWIVYPSQRIAARRALMALLLGMIFTAPIAIRYIHDSLQGHWHLAGPSLLIEASIPHRIAVWNFIAEEIAKSPLLGHGVDSTRFLVADRKIEYMNTTSVLHPHNAVLQAWVEFGLLGALALAAFTVMLFRKIDGMPAYAQKYYTALCITLALILSMGYSVWQSWQIGMITAICAFSVMAVKLYGSETNPD